MFWGHPETMRLPSTIIVHKNFYFNIGVANQVHYFAKKTPQNQSPEEL